MKGLPAIFRNILTEEEKRGWELDQMIEKFPDVLFRNGLAPYPKATKRITEPNLQIFQFGTLPASFALDFPNCLPVYGIKYSFADYFHEDVNVACRLLSNLRTPRFIRDGAPTIPLGGLLVGVNGTQTPDHQHEAAINILFQGSKLWKIGECDSFVQKAGDMVFIPGQMAHFVQNLDFSVAWTFQFHENHFQTTVGREELLSIVNAFVQQQSLGELEQDSL